jgi:hypothetical protein
VESTEKRLAEADTEEEDVLNGSTLSEEQQIERLSKTVARKRVLERKLEHGRSGIESAEAELEHVAGEAMRSFHGELSDLRGARQAKNLAILKKLVAPEQWPWAEMHALNFVRYASDLAAIEWLGHQAGNFLSNGAVQQAAEALLIDIAKLEGEKGEKAGKR